MCVCVSIYYIIKLVYIINIDSFDKASRFDQFVCAVTEPELILFETLYTSLCRSCFELVVELLFELLILNCTS